MERAPWWGGFFERMVQSVKRCLRKVLGNARLTFDELLTTLVEVEGTLNSRPLTYAYDEVGSEPLTPSHLMVGRLMSMPDGVVTDGFSTCVRKSNIFVIECAFACLIVDIHGKKKIFETFFPFSPALTGRGGVVFNIERREW